MAFGTINGLADRGGHGCSVSPTTFLNLSPDPITRDAWRPLHDGSWIWGQVKILGSAPLRTAAS